MEKEVIERIRYLAQKYEAPEFLEKDPSQFMHEYTAVEDQEIAAFISANLAFGRRDQILKHIHLILDAIRNQGDRPLSWILSQKYKDFFTNGNKSFYRMYTDDDMLLFFETLKQMLEKSGSLGSYVYEKWTQAINEKGKSEKGDRPLYPQNEKIEKGDRPLYLHQLISQIFPTSCKLIPHTKNSAAKKVNMMLRWLVRDNSPVDLGLWTWYSKKDLLIPLDTHVMQESARLGLFSSINDGEGIQDFQKIPSPSLKTTELLTNSLKEVFPEDPVKADFALFGLGVSEN